MKQIETNTRRNVLKTVGTGVVGGIVLTGSASGREGASLNRSLAEVRSATAKYNDPENAVADGYLREGHPVCGMGYHFPHEDFVAAVESDDPAELAAYLGPLDRTDPPVLAYGEGDDGLVLGAVEYLTLDNTEDLFPSTDKDEWDPFFGPLYALHAWVHFPNPEGVFHPTNPRPQFTQPEWCE
jgi:hypothetical protein